MKPDILVKAELWEADEYVITVDGKPVGKTLSLDEAESRIIPWLKTAIYEITKGSKVTCLRSPEQQGYQRTPEEGKLGQPGQDTY